MSVVRDADGTPLHRTRDGDLVPYKECDPTPSDRLPAGLCLEHSLYGDSAATCRACWSEMKAGDRPRQYLGRVWEADP